jgi:hypothetical protein
VLAVLGAWAFSTAKKAADAIKATRSQALAQADAALARADSACQHNRSRIEELKAELTSRAVGFPDIKVTPIDFALRSAEVSGHHVLLDQSESHAPVKLKAIDVSAMEEGLSHISDKVQALLQVPPLLTPEEHDHSDDPVHELFGEESDLQQLVGQFTLSLGKLRDIDLTLPLVPKGSLLVERAASASLPKAEAGPRVHMASQLNPKAIAAFVDQVNSNRERGLAIFAELNEVFGNLRSGVRTLRPGPGGIGQHPACQPARRVGQRRLVQPPGVLPAHHPVHRLHRRAAGHQGVQSLFVVV